MSFNIEVRKKQLQSLDQYITSSRDRVLSVLNYLGWNTNNTLKSDEQHVCPINHTHRVPLEKMDKHIQKCCLKSAGYKLDDTFMSEVPISKETSISLDTPTKINILNAARQKTPKFTPAWNGLDPDPMTSDRLLSTFSSDERLAIYEYCVQNTKAPPTPSEFCVDTAPYGKDERKDGPLTKEELLEEERNAKRRRIKYKAVHTGRNKSYSEIMKEVIDNQMEMYKEYLINKEEQNKLITDSTEQINEHDSNGHSVQVPDTTTTDIKYEHNQDFYQQDYNNIQTIERIYDRYSNQQIIDGKHDDFLREEDKYLKYNQTFREEDNNYDRSNREDKQDRLYREDKYDRPSREDKNDRSSREDKYDRSNKEDKYDRSSREDKYDRSSREDKYDRSSREDKHDRFSREDKYDKTSREDKYDRTIREDKYDRTNREDKYDRSVREDKYDHNFRDEKYDRSYKEGEKHDRFNRDDRGLRDDDRYDKSFNEEKHGRSFRDDRYDRSVKEQNKYSERHRDHKEKNFSYKRHRNSYERSVERRESYHKPKYRH